MKLYIKNMVCPCCAMYVKKTVEASGLVVESMNLSEVIITTRATEEQLSAIDERLRMVDLELMPADNNVIVEKMKLLINEYQKQIEETAKFNFSHYLSDKLRYNYSYLSNVFSKREGMTIREYSIKLRIEAAKRMLVQEGLELGEIACKLNYSSVAHLSAQFKKFTGMTSSEFKRASGESYSSSSMVA
jgi:YesN/AraC family two-component response regulator